jgi:hypothetical protein
MSTRTLGLDQFFDQFPNVQHDVSMASVCTLAYTDDETLDGLIFTVPPLHSTLDSSGAQSQWPMHTDNETEGLICSALSAYTQYAYRADQLTRIVLCGEMTKSNTKDNNRKTGWLV